MNLSSLKDRPPPVGAVWTFGSFYILPGDQGQQRHDNAFTKAAASLCSTRSLARSPRGIG